MNLKKLYELENKQNARLISLREEHEKMRAECDAMRDRLPQILIEKGQDDAEKLATELNKKSMLVEAQETSIHQLEANGCIYYTDVDVLEGYREYAREYNTQFRKLHNAYLKCFDEAFSLFKKMVDLRRTGKAIREEFLHHLADKSLIDNGIVLETLDVRNKLSKDSVGNFAMYYGDPTTYNAIQEHSEDISVF